MRRHLFAMGLVLACGLGAIPSMPAARGDKPAEPETCGSYGTTVEFVDSPKEAAKLAEKAGKLVLVLHVSGNFEDPRFT